MRFIVTLWALHGGLSQLVAAFHVGLNSHNLRYPSEARSCDRTAIHGAVCTPGAARVALTREAGKNDKLAALLKEAGISSVEVPCIAHQDGPDLPMLPIALREKGLSYVIITSPEAAKVFLGGWKGAGRPSVPVACVGKSTGEVLEAGGITPVFTPSKATGETLAAEIPFPSSCEADGEKQQEGEHKGPRILYPASAKAQMTLEEGLSARGFEVQRLNTYDTVPAEWSIEAEAAAASASVATFGSPSAVKTWAARLGVRHLDRNSALAACIGETSAKACREAGWSDATIFYPEKPGIQGWAEAVRNALTSLEATP